MSVFGSCQTEVSALVRRRRPSRTASSSQDHLVPVILVPMEYVLVLHPTFYLDFSPERIVIQPSFAMLLFYRIFDEESLKDVPVPTVVRITAPVFGRLGIPRTQFPPSL